MTAESDPTTSSSTSTSPPSPQIFPCRDLTRRIKPRTAWITVIALLVLGVGPMVAGFLVRNQNRMLAEELYSLTPLTLVVVLPIAGGLLISLSPAGLRSMSAAITIDAATERITFAGGWMGNTSGRFTRRAGERSYPIESVVVLTSRHRFDAGTGVKFLTPDGELLMRPLEDPAAFARLVAIPKHDVGKITHVCPSCGYSLLGNTSGRCAECGGVILSLTPGIVASRPAAPPTQPTDPVEGPRKRHDS